MPKQKAAKPNRQSNVKAVGIASLIVFAVFAGALYLTPLSSISSQILPGFQGEQNGLAAYQVKQTAVATLNTPIPNDPNNGAQYTWQGVATPSSASVQACQGNTCSTLFMGAQVNPVTSTPLYGNLQTVDYCVPVPNNVNQKQCVSGQVMQYTFSEDLQIQASGGYFGLSGDTIWNTLSSTIYNQIITGPNGLQGNAFETPLYAVVTNAQWQNQGNNQVNIGTVGQALTFYSQPNAQGVTFASSLNWNPNSQVSLNSTLNSVYAPDSRMQNLVYYPISLQAFAPLQVFGDVLGCAPAGCNYPNLHATMTLYTLRIGEFILTNQDKTNLSQFTGQTCNGAACLWDGLAGAFGCSILNLGACVNLAALGTIITVVIIGVVAILTAPLWVPLLGAWIMGGGYKKGNSGKGR